MPAAGDLARALHRSQRPRLPPFRAASRLFAPFRQDHEDPDVSHLLRKSLAGTVGGFAATFPMTAYMTHQHAYLPPTQRYPLPPREITEAVVDQAADAGLAPRPDEKTLYRITMASHFGYGAAVGTLYPWTAGRLPLPSLLKGIVFGLGVWTVSYLGLLPSLGLLAPATKHPPKRTRLMIAAHVVWGAALGLVADRALSPARPR
jgi:uncharacterized membrane protein YagU involved in acid resistance